MNATLAEPLFLPRRSSDQRPIDSIERTPEAVAAMPRWRRLITHPAIVWLPGMILFSFGQVVLLVVFLILGQDPENETQHGWTTFISASIGYAFVLILLERRRPRELTRRPALFLAAGLGIGALLLIVSATAVHLLRGVEWGPTNDSVRWASAVLWLGIAPALSEELLFRGILFRYAEQALGTWFALALSAAFFGLVHLGNENATLWGAIAIAIQAGILLGALYALTRSLWLVIGVHFAWNIVQGPVLGFNVSGTTGFSGWLSPTPVGDPLLSGGTFGLEGSVVVVVLVSLLSIAALALLIRRGGVIRPAWARKNRAAIAAPAQA